MSTTGSLVSVDGRAALRFERRLRAPIERAWRAVTEPAELERWFVAPVPWTPVLGETFAAGGQEGRITALEAPCRLAWTWGEERYAFELEPDGEGACRLTFTHVFTREYGPADQHAGGWEAYLDRLDAHLAGGHLTEQDAHAVVPELQRVYRARFGELTLEDGPVLRLERRFDHAPERVWRALTDPAELAHWFPADAPMEIVEQDPPRSLAATWFGDELRFDLRPDGDGCLLVFSHAFADRETSARTAAGWERCFARLGALLGGEPMDEAASLRDWPEAHERYAAVFGVDPGLGRRAYAEHPAT